MSKLNALNSNDESSTVAASQSRVYKNIIAANNARQMNGDVHGNIHIGDIHNHLSHISMLSEISAKA
jgi:hypothetical protein